MLSRGIAFGMVDANVSVYTTQLKGNTSTVLSLRFLLNFPAPALR